VDQEEEEEEEEEEERERERESFIRNYVSLFLIKHEVGESLVQCLSLFFLEGGARDAVATAPVELDSMIVSVSQCAGKCDLLRRYKKSYNIFCD